MNLVASKKICQKGAAVSREKENYRNNLELILKDFPNKNLLSVSDVAKWGGRDRRVVKECISVTRRF